MVEHLAVRIRDAVEADLPAFEWDGEFVHFRRLYRRAFDEAQRGLRFVLVAEQGGAVVGQLFAHLATRWRTHFPGGFSGYLHSFRVKPAYRRMGIGTRLIEHAEERLLAQGFRHAVISVARQNAGARRLYESLGYAVYSEESGDWAYLDHEGRLRHIHEPAFVLHKALSTQSPPHNPLWHAS